MNRDHPCWHGIAYVVARTAAGGRADGFASCAGTAIGGLIHVAAAAFGLSVLISQSALAFALVKYLGAAYLVYLGIRTLTARAPAADLPIAPTVGACKALREGLMVEGLNVKTAMFFLAFIPQFVSTEHALAPQFLLLGTICAALNTAADLLAVVLAAKFAAADKTHRAREQLLIRASGVSLLGLGLYVALARHGV
jgi:threonine/homoserine/homoserine lactone efflux protein